MSEYDIIINRIKDKISNLKEQNVSLANENEELISQVLKLNASLEENEKRIKELENKNLNLQFSKGLGSEEQDKINHTINGLIIEIDRGLELLKS